MELLTTLTCLVCIFAIVVIVLSTKKPHCDLPETNNARIPLDSAKLCINCNCVFAAGERCICGSTKSHTPLKGWLDHNPNVTDIEGV